jgi:YggT family protein
MEVVMYAVGNLLFAIAKILDVVLSIYMWIIIARALLSWVSPDPRNRIVQILHQLTDPVLWRIRRFLPFRGVGIDFSPVVVILAIIFLRSFLVGTLLDIARGM